MKCQNLCPIQTTRDPITGCGEEAEEDKSDGPKVRWFVFFMIHLWFIFCARIATQMNLLIDVLLVVGPSVYEFLTLKDMLRLLLVSHTTKDLVILSKYKFCIDDILLLVERWRRWYYVKKVMPSSFWWNDGERRKELTLFKMNECFVVNTVIEVCLSSLQICFY